jgi:hypothetical protein
LEESTVNEEDEENSSNGCEEHQEFLHDVGQENDLVSKLSHLSQLIQYLDYTLDQDNSNDLLDVDFSWQRIFISENFVGNLFILGCESHNFLALISVHVVVICVVTHCPVDNSDENNGCIKGCFNEFNFHIILVL